LTVGSVAISIYAAPVTVRAATNGARAQYLTEKDRRVLMLAQTTTALLGLEVDEV
jgi:hypothetical protein